MVGIEPASMTAVFGHNAADRKAETWRQRLLPFDHLEFVVSDAAKGIAAAVEQVAERRREKDPSAPPLGHGLDLFHTTQEAERVLANIEGIEFIYFSEKDVVRHKLVQMIIKAYETHTKKSEI